ncbi:hypothetical protein BTR23_24895 [Alkalihalophilus pseudofirmus]|nr:hypothetical protein BTR23_24895 [Alkalihalophilus pseudofirmus]
MFSLFEEFFGSIKDIGLSGFTNMYLFFQLLLFVLMVGITAYFMVREMNVMKKVKKQIEPLNRLSNEEAAALDKQMNDIFSNIRKSRYKEQWSRYYERVSEKSEDERIKVEPFFGFDILLHRMGYRSFMDVGAGICVSIGVLGTFIGLSTGLTDLNTGNTDELRTGIDGLLAGMKVAFYTSVFGVVLSILWIAFDRIFSSRMEAHIDWHTERMDYLLSTDDEELFLNRLEKISKSQADHLKTLLTDALEKAMQPVVSTIQQSNGHVKDAFGELNHQFGHLQDGISTQTKLLESQLELTKQSGSDIANQLVEQVTGGTEKSINEFSSLIQDTKSMQEQMMTTIEHMVTNFSATEERQQETAKQTEKMFAHFEKVGSELDEMRESYQATSNHMNQLGSTIQTIQQLSQDQLPIQQEVMNSNKMLAEKYEKISDGFNQFNEKVEKRHEDMLNQLVQFSTEMASTYREMTAKFSESLDKQVHSLHESDRLLESVKEVVRTLTPIAPSLTEVVGSIDHLKEQLHHMTSTQKELLPELVELKSGTTKTITDALETTRMYMGNMNEQIGQMERHWSTTKEQFAATRESLDISLKGFSENIDTGLTKTYEHFDKTLTDAVSEVSNLINHYREVQEDLVDGLEELGDILANKSEVSRS